MKRLLIFFIGIILCAHAAAQVPFFGTSPGKNHIYTYNQVSFVPGENSQGLFIFSHYGITERVSAGIEFIGGGGALLQGFNLKYQFVKQDYLNLAIQTSARMDLFDGYQFDHQNISLFMNGTIVKGLGYVTNTYFNVFRDGSWQANQFWYLSYTIDRFTPFVGLTHNWIGDYKPDLSVALACNFGNLNLYAWSGDLCSGHPTFTIGIDYLFALTPRK